MRLAHAVTPPHHRLPRVTAEDSRQAALARLVDQEGKRVFALARQVCGNVSDAEDLAQETFLAAYRALDQLADPDNPRPWLYAIARRACKRLRRRRAGEPARLESLDELLPHPAETIPDAALLAEGPHHDRLRTEARERVERAVAELPETFRMPLLLADVAELSLPEIAGVLGIKEATVKTRIHRARLKLRDVLAAGLPQRPIPPAEHSRRVCLDLLRARLEALDRRAPFPYSNAALCERCRAVLATLDLAAGACARLADGQMPPELRARILAAASPPDRSPL
jgi:RNA polymerase sigma-70 factor (ECF subfamily)